MKKSFHGLFSIKSLQNNYLSLAIVAVLFIPSFAHAQYDSTKILQDQNSYGFRWKNGDFTFTLGIPKDTLKLAVKDSNRIAIKGGKMWHYDGYKWVSVQSGIITGPGGVPVTMTWINQILCLQQSGVADQCVDFSRLPVTWVQNYNRTRFVGLNGNGDAVDSVDMRFTYLREGSNVSFSFDGDTTTISASGSGGTGGISKVGSPAYGLTRINDSTYIVDTAVITSQTRTAAGLALKQDVLNGTGFVKSTAGTISYDNSTYLTANQAVTVTATGDATGTSSASGTAPSLPLTLATVNSNVGSFTNANVTVNGKGLVTAVSNGSAASALYAGFGLKKSADSASVLADTTFGRVITSKYKGMMAYCLGDSYAQMRLYQAALKNGLGVDTTTNGISGSTITGSTTGVASIVSRIDAALATNPDIIIIEGGSNDYILGKTIGTISSTDTLTYYGALNYIAQKCVAKTYAIKIVPVNLLQRGSSRAAYATQKAYADAMYQVFALYGIPVVDMFNGSGVTYENMNVYSTDGIHPDRAAGIKKYGDYLVNAILTSPNVLPNISSASTGWNLTGNANTDSSLNFVGTTTPNRLMFGVNGVRAGLIDWAGMNVTSLGYGALLNNSNSSGLQNTAHGYLALTLNTTGQYNTAIGAVTLSKNTTSSSSTAVGANALSLSTGANNTATGAGAMQNNVSGFSNVANGTSSLNANGGGFQNTASGMFSLAVNTNGSQAAAFGFNALGQSNGDYNTAVGRTALYGNSSGTNNTGVGYNTGFTNTTSSYKVLLGNEAGTYETSSNKLHIASHKEYSLINGDFSTGVASIGNLFMSTVNIVTSGTGGSLAAGNYYYYVVALDGTGESFTTQVGYTATGSTSQISLNWASVPWATGYKIYRGTVNGVYTNYFTTTTLGFTETGTTGTAGTPLAYNTAYMMRTSSTGLSIAGKLNIGTGLNASVGTATLAAGTVTVSTTAALTASKIFVTVVTPGGTQGFLSVPTIVNATSFTISSTSGSETSTVNWWIIN